jgi:hypothetical protein
MGPKRPLSRRELAALSSIDASIVGIDYWEDETIRLYRGLGLVRTAGERINLTQAGRRAIGRRKPRRSPVRLMARPAMTPNGRSSPGAGPSR